jgi:hypothetical protein
MKTDNASRENGFESVPAYLRETQLDTELAIHLIFLRNQPRN